MDGFVITSNHLAGIQLAYGLNTDRSDCLVGGTADLHNGAVLYNPVGVNVQTDPFDVERLMDNVVYFENGTNLDSALLHVPDVGDIDLEE